MTSIFVSVGQCGNQLANTLLEYLNQNQHNRQTSYLFKYNDDKFRFVALDSETKVISNLADGHRERIRLENLVNAKCGRGSNWAAGYAGLDKESSLKIIEKCMESIRKEAERSDFLLNFNLMHSLSGGTGSGCTSKLIEHLREEYGYKKYLFMQSVAPFRDGELPLQHYNNLLCMSHLHEFTDVIYLHQNDDVLRFIEKVQAESIRSGSAGTNKLPPIAMNARIYKKTSSATNEPTDSISFNDMNSFIIRNLLSCIFPVDNVSLKTQSIGMEQLEIQRLLCSNPSMKIVELYNVNTDSESESRSNPRRNSPTKTNPLLKQILSTIPKYRSDSQSIYEHYTSLSSLLISRNSSDSAESSASKQSSQVTQLIQELDSIKKALNPVDWNPFTIDFWSSSSTITEPLKATKPNSKSAYESSLTFALNRDKCVDYLSEIKEKSLLKFNAKAYLHWYEKFRVSEEDFLSAFDNLQTMIDSYNAIRNS